MYFEPKSYHHYFAADRFHFTTVSFREKKWTIGVDHSSWREELTKKVGTEAGRIACQLDELMEKDAVFFKQLKAASTTCDSSLLKEMSLISQQANIGPKAMISSSICHQLGQWLLEDCHPKELVINDGHNLFINVVRPLKIPVLAGEHPLSGMVGYTLEPDQCPLVIGNSDEMAGSMMHYGNADQVLIFSSDGLVAGAWAAACFNRIKTSNDIQGVLDGIKAFPEIPNALVIMEDQTGIHGALDLTWLD